MHAARGGIERDENAEQLQKDSMTETLHRRTPNEISGVIVVNRYIEERESTPCPFQDLIRVHSLPFPGFDTCG